MSRFWIVPSAMSLLVTRELAVAVAPPTASAVIAHAAMVFRIARNPSFRFCGDLSPLEMRFLSAGPRGLSRTHVRRRTAGDQRQDHAEPRHVRCHRYGDRQPETCGQEHYAETREQFIE